MQEVYKMTWSEFQIRLFAYNRIQKREDFRFREVAYASLIGFHSDPKRIPKSKDAFWPIDKEAKKRGVSDEQKQAFLEAYKNYKDGH